MAQEGPQQSLKLNITIASGSGTGTLTNQWTVARWIRIKPVNETDSFTVTISDADSVIMMKRTAQTGTLSEQLNMSLGIMATIAITAASVDGTYTVKLDMH